MNPKAEARQATQSKGTNPPFQVPLEAFDSLCQNQKVQPGHQRGRAGRSETSGRVKLVNRAMLRGISCSTNFQKIAPARKPAERLRKAAGTPAFLLVR